MMFQGARVFSAAPPNGGGGIQKAPNGEIPFAIPITPVGMDNVNATVLRASDNGSVVLPYLGMPAGTEFYFGLATVDTLPHFHSFSCTPNGTTFAYAFDNSMADRLTLGQAYTSWVPGMGGNKRKLQIQGAFYPGHEYACGVSLAGDAADPFAWTSPSTSSFGLSVECDLSTIPNLEAHAAPSHGQLVVSSVRDLTSGVDLKQGLASRSTPLSFNVGFHASATSPAIGGLIGAGALFVVLLLTVLLLSRALKQS